jgi:outer membrane protein insertion porin family
VDEAKAGGYTDAEAEIIGMKPFGGTQELFYNLEFQFPLISEAGIKGVVFYDIGDADNELALSNLRQDFGFGFRWFSPIGPLRFEWGFPIQRRESYGEDSVNFEFAIGSPF